MYIYIYIYIYACDVGEQIHEKPRYTSKVLSCAAEEIYENEDPHSTRAIS